MHPLSAVLTLNSVKQEIAKEGILPFSRFFARNYDGITRFFSNGFRDQTFRDFYIDKTPLGALLLHWFFSILIIACTWGVSSPTSAYAVVFGVFSYVVDAFFGICLALGLIVLRLTTDWHLISPSNATISIIAATLFAIANAFPIIVLWVPPTAEFATSYPWFLVPTTGICLLVAGVLYWVGFSYVVPHVGRNAGKELRGERVPIFRVEHGERVQAAEVVSFAWVIKSWDLDTELEDRHGHA
jgi:hypothetical protein